MNEFIHELEQGWLQVKVPLPFSLKWVNSYLIPEKNGYTMIDPGLRTDEAIAVWEQVLKQYGISWSAITSIIVTHQHPDHYGLAGYVQERSGAPVYMSSRSHSYALRLWGVNSDYASGLHQLFRAYGMPVELLKAIEDNLATFVDRVSPQPKVTYIEVGEKLQLGGMSWELIETQGHAYGQLCFYQPDRAWMICGDQVLPHITPNVSVVPGEEPDPLHDFLTSLEHLKSYHVQLAFPGHRDPFTLFEERIHELQQHHERRLQRMIDMLAEEPRNAFDLCEALFGNRLRLNPHNLRFAMSETLAHLFYLELRKQLVFDPESKLFQVSD